jgi:hypothetical protein
MDRNKKNIIYFVFNPRAGLYIEKVKIRNPYGIGYFCFTLLCNVRIGETAFLPICTMGYSIDCPIMQAG